jgi:multiple antibiotic resistance protein
MEQIANALRAVGLLVMLLNPFLLIVYLVDIVQKVNTRLFARILIRAGFISSAVFVLFAIGGDFIFNILLQAKFESLQIFGGVILLIIGIQFVFKGNSAIEGLRGDPEHIAGSLAMPIMIGPGTISASMITGKELSALYASLAIVLALVFTILIMIGLKMTYDYVIPRKEKLVERYIEITGRITALVVGTYAIDLIMQGLKGWSIF